MNSQISNFKMGVFGSWQRGTWKLVFVWCLVFGVWCFRSPAANTNAVLNSWLAAQTNLHTWTADFTQTRTIKTLTQPLTAIGHIWFATPNRFRWELGSPAKTIAVRNADEMMVIYPRLKRAEKYPLGDNAPGEWRDMLSLLDAGFPRDRADFDSRFQLVSLVETNGGWQLTMRPRSAFARKMMSEIRLGLSAKDFSLTSTELIFLDGSRMRNDFANARLNVEVDAALFEPKLDGNYKIAEPLKR